MAVFITGGARSGKSDFAERYAMRLSSKGIYIATAQSWDNEMTARIQRHQTARESAGFAWRTIEEPLALAETIRQLENETAGLEERPAVLIDCLTLWLTNQMLQLEPHGDQAAAGITDEPTLERPKGQQHDLDAVTDELVNAVASYSGPLLLVTNEVGSGIVPAYPLGRRFRDEAGRMNRRLAAICGQAFLVVAGFPLDLKAHAFMLEDR
ncbi:bifunctional adenosylcobinamide kinase/adenosylcobinamide-phosphate guanylyltransferase [Paenibacillus sp. sptzw28]|uniref:bifunctional adenosylcobinamide kinase/adenosylcobinamide-phosphate guanylyltransferase n=1 Tax=Paenibacillus sp. sptzw28 TaxID=715179 RepID=UPI001C6E37F3|nr:bifunctional adenosylcobinamide kinase/adenosylcobinamide-phosphate guanylyltransferase [Paenibacillus sp. sptzw28]QYR19686.1 bifunctional adenosylcobinamide kinase/adenosylcobinamide-phosphate guanylyltransferase [Paenibacillus sp. sptzw28]